MTGEGGGNGEEANGGGGRRGGKGCHVQRGDLGGGGVGT